MVCLKNGLLVSRVGSIFKRGATSLRLKCISGIENTSKNEGGRTRGKKLSPKHADNGSTYDREVVHLRPDQIINPKEDEEEEALGSLMNAVVKVSCVHSPPNFSMPWQRCRQYSSTSSGFAIMDGDSRYIVTNAHSVEYHRQVELQRRGDDTKFPAAVLSIGVECDLAVLSVADEDFWKDMEFLQFGPLPRLQDQVAVVGYPIGGDTISVTVGVVSRIEVTSYSHGSTELLGVQIDAAINSGNSGGPVFNSNGQCVGVAFQSLSGDAENIGYMIPTPVALHFLEDYRKNGKFTGFPVIGIHWQSMENTTLRAAYGLEKDQKGVLVRDLAPLTAAAKILKPDDIILSFDGVQLANDGTVPFRTGERIAFSFLTTQKFTWESAMLGIFRDGVQSEVEIPLSRPSALVPAHINNESPSYFVVSGLVFTSLTEPYLSDEYGDDYLRDAPVKFIDRFFHGKKVEEDQAVVILSQVLASEETRGYERIGNIQVKRFNGVKINKLSQLAKLVMECQDKFYLFDLEFDQVLVMDTEKAKLGTQKVMADHCIPQALSNDVQEGLPQWPPPLEQ